MGRQGAPKHSHHKRVSILIIKLAHTTFWARWSPETGVGAPLALHPLRLSCHEGEALPYPYHDLSMT